MHVFKVRWGFFPVLRISFEMQQFGLSYELNGRRMVLM